MAGSTGKWLLEDVPKAGWTCDSVTDAREGKSGGFSDDYPVCQMCETTRHRWVHAMSHAAYGTLECGCDCAGHMQGSVSAAQERQAKAISEAARKAKLGDSWQPWGFYFVTGAAGDGKTTFIREKLQGFKWVGMTGFAAVNLLEGIQTLHSALGLGIVKTISDKMREKIKSALFGIRNRHGGLVIDECSMLTPEILQVIYEECRDLQMPLYLVGDFAQLPPVSDEDIPLAFDASCWKDVTHIVLPRPGQPTRQQEDPVFEAALKALRVGDGKESLKLMRQAGVRFVSEPDPEFPGLTLFAWNRHKDAFNKQFYDKLKGEEKVFETTLTGDVGEIPPTVRLKMGAKVSLTANIYANRKLEIANGEIGRVVGFGEAWENSVYVEFNRVGLRKIERMDRDSKGEMVLEERIIDGVPTMVDFAPILGTVTFMPLELAWASTVHRAQGLTAEYGAQVSLANLSMKQDAMLYVAASRCRRGRDLIFIGEPKQFIWNCQVSMRVKERGYLDLEQLRQSQLKVANA